MDKKIDFGSMVFGDEAMRKYLPNNVYNAMRNTIDAGRSLDEGIANIVSNAMKDWAIANGATHYAHWIQPMTGATAEKHDAFIAPAPGGTILQEFSGKDLIKCEADASSFPSGGLRNTAEARGYSAWDPTSYAFIKDGVLCIPAALWTYYGDALDKKTPLLRSMEALNRQSLRVLRALGDEETEYTIVNVGPEQEYFLIDAELVDSREDLKICGRTLFGALAAKGQQLEDGFLISPPARVKAFMEELNDELWKLGVMCKTEHTETAPGQYEMATIFTTTNRAADNNQLTMELMKKVAKRHGLACLLTEKPFAGINGSGKHNNWSISTNTGVNLLDPGAHPDKDLRFLAFLVACIAGVDEYQDLLRISCATAGNDHRLGAAEAPPAIVSIHMGSQLTEMLDCFEKGTDYAGETREVMRVGVNTAPPFLRDPTDRNRTSSFPFTGNRFEFRMVGSSQSVSGANTMLNTIVAEALSNIADQVENGADMATVLRRTLTAHKRIIFNGNGYAKAWVEEAERRGLSNYHTSTEALSHFLDAKNVAVLKKHGIYSARELKAVNEIWFDEYIATVGIECRVLLDMLTRKILPAASAYMSELSASVLSQREVYAGAGGMEAAMLARISPVAARVYDKTETLRGNLAATTAITNTKERALAMRRDVFEHMLLLRKDIDELEGLVAADYWPYPTYSELVRSAGDR